MPEEFVLYQKFTDTTIAEEIAAVLKDNGIEGHLQNNLHAYVNIVGYNPIDFAIGLNLKPADFPAADKILETYYAQLIEKADKDYYLFDFTNEELHDIIANPYDWGQFDYQLAKHILKAKGEDISDAHVQEMKKAKIDALSEKKKLSQVKLISGYILSILVPVAAIIIGITIIYNRTVLPNGQKFYIHTEKERAHGKRMIVISLVWMFIALVINSYRAD